MAQMKQGLLGMVAAPGGVTRFYVEDLNTGQKIAYLESEPFESDAFCKKVIAGIESIRNAKKDQPKTEVQLRGEAAAYMSEHNVDPQTAVCVVTLKEKVALHIKQHKCSYVDALRAVTRQHPELWAGRE